MELYLLNPTQQDMDGLIRHFEGTPLADNLNTWVEENPSWMDREVPCKYLPRSYPSRQEIRMGEFILQIYLRDDCEDLETLTDMYSGTQIGPLIEKGTYYIRKAEETRKEYLSLIEQKLAGLDLESYSLRKLVDLCAQLR